MENLNGSVERVTYFNPENGYSVIKVLPEGKRRLEADREGLITVVGSMPELSVGESVQFEGEWVSDPRWGKQFKAQRVTSTLPTSEQGITRFLASGIVRGIGKETAKRIVDRFGLETLDILDNHPDRLEEVIKPSLARDLAKAWRDARESRRVMVFLQGYGVTAKTAIKIVDQYGDETIEKVQENPYQLAEDIFGIGFIKADAIAKQMGVPDNAPGRLRAGLSYALESLASEGHTYAPRKVLVQTTAELLKVDEQALIDEQLNAELKDRKLLFDPLPSEYAPGAGADMADEMGIRPALVEAIYLPSYYYAERGCTKRLKTLASASSPIARKTKNVNWETFLSDLAGKNSVKLTEQQQGAVRAALTSKISVLTGGPGTGKTTTLRMVINALIERKFTFALASPTGRAAKRLGEATEQMASTIHRLLGFSPIDMSFEHDEENPLNVDMVIVDEASMIDVSLFNSLLKALKPETHLMLVGDVDQLPSVGAGNVLRDVIDSEIGHVTRLEVIFRQSKKSRIVVNAHRVNHGEVPETDNDLEGDFFMFRVNDPERAAAELIKVVTEKLPEQFGFDPMNDIQVIAPMYRGAAGVHLLNETLQAALNNSGRMAERKLHGRTYRVGDKVMQTKNNYEKEVFNGDIGRIRGIDFDDQQLEVVIDGRIVDYTFNEAEQLIHAYCISTHRSQGSEYPVVVMPLLTQHFMMLQRNLLYTAITRAKRMCVLVGNPHAMKMAVENNKVAERYSGLLARLKG
jgi:exodeoxyribonuclease V alpha subunit